MRVVYPHNFQTKFTYDAAGDDEESWMQTTITGSGNLSFYWKVSSDIGDYLRFYIDDELQAEITGNQGWANWWGGLTGTHTLKWVYSKDSSGSSGSDAGWVDKVVWQPWATPPATLAEAVDSFLTYTTGGTANCRTCFGGYFDNDSAQSGTIGNSQESWMQTTVSGPGTIRFWWKVSSEAYYDWLEFFDGVQQDSISGEVDWTETSYTVTGTGSHTLKWRYAKDGSGSYGEDCAYVDYVQWTGPLPQDPPTDAWRELTYVYDASGRRVEKRYDGLTILKYIYDGDHCIAEYDAGGNLRRKYIYGPGVDEPVCMIEATVTPAATYYYHFDALGSVVALTNSSGNTVEVYDYSVYGQVGATDPSHTNRFMFTGREFDKETGLYYYRARYYKPEIGRFLQADPVGYDAGMNLYRYCSNNPWNAIDPFGLETGYYPGYGIIGDPCRVDPCKPKDQAPHDSNWVDCMGRCIADNDPIDLALEALVAHLAAGVLPKSVIAALADVVGETELPGAD